MLNARILKFQKFEKNNLKTGAVLVLVRPKPSIAFNIVET